MPRAGRVVIDGGTYHVLTRGNNGQTVFHHDADYQRYLQLLSNYAHERQLKVYHFALMPNHVHLVLEVVDGPALSKAMHGLNLSYALYYRKRHAYRGHLWQDRFKSLLIDRESYLLECGRYVELNPVRAGLVREPREYPWSSYRAYAEGAFNPLLASHPLYPTLGATTSERQKHYIQFVDDRLKPRQSQAQASRIFGQYLTAAQNPFEHVDQYFSFSLAKRRRGRPKKLQSVDGKKRTVPIFGFGDQG